MVNSLHQMNNHHNQGFVEVYTVSKLLIITVIAASAELPFYIKRDNEYSSGISYSASGKAFIKGAISI